VPNPEFFDSETFGWRPNQAPHKVRPESLKIKESLFRSYKIRARNRYNTV